MVSRRPFYVLVALLLTVGVGLMIYRHMAFDVPWLPGEYRQLWSVEAKVEFDANEQPVVASLAIPATQPGFTLIDESAASPGYGLAFVDKNGVTRADWSIRSAKGHQELYYRVDMMIDPTPRHHLPKYQPSTSRSRRSPWPPP